jgi:DNA-binding MarR family transcriptional regulator
MMATRSRATGVQVPSDLSPTGKLIYLYLVQQGRTTAEELKGALDIPQIRLYPTLEALERQELIERAGGEFGVTR